MIGWLDSDWMEQLGWVLLHSFWQLSLLAVAVHGLKRTWFHASAIGQHRLLSCGLALMTLSPIATWYSASRDNVATRASASTARTPVHPSKTPWPEPHAMRTDPADVHVMAGAMLNHGDQAAGTELIISSEKGRMLFEVSWLALAWLAGFTLFSLRLMVGVWGHQQWKRRAKLRAPNHLVNILSRASQRVGIRAEVSLRLTNARVSPMVTGWLRPMIILPASILTSMSPSEIELLLAHELAHVRRNDCLVNLLQILVETVFFYHPAVWWVSRQLRITREHCCDDLAAKDASSRLNLGRALLILEQQRSRAPLLSLSAADGDLLKRIRRLSHGEPRPCVPVRLCVATCMVCLAAVSSLSCSLPFAVAQEQKTVTQEQESGTPALHAIETPETDESTQADQEGNAAPESEEVDLVKQLPAIEGNRQYWDLTLEECLGITLQNAKPVLPISVEGRDGSRMNALGDPTVADRQTRLEQSSLSARDPNGDVHSMPKVILLVDASQSVDELEMQIRNLVRDVEVSYWNLNAAYQVASTIMTGHDHVRAVLRMARLQQRNGDGKRHDVTLAVELCQQFRLLWDAALSGSKRLGEERLGIYAHEEKLRELLGLANTDGRLIRPVQEPSMERVSFDWNESAISMLAHSPELRQQRAGIEQRQLELNAAKKRITPEVILGRLYDWIGSGDASNVDELKRDRSQVEGGVLPDASRSSSGVEQVPSDPSEPRNGQSALEAEPPFVNRRLELAKIRGASLRRDRERFLLQERERLFAARLSAALNQLTTDFQRLQTCTVSRDASQRELETRLSEYKKRGGPVNVLLQCAEQNVNDAIAYHRALRDYNQSINYVRYLSGTLLPGYNIGIASKP